MDAQPELLEARRRGCIRIHACHGGVTEVDLRLPEGSQDEFVLRGVVDVGRPGGDPGPGRDRAHRGAVQAVLGNQVSQCRADERRAVHARRGSGAWGRRRRRTDPHARRREVDGHAGLPLGHRPQRGDPLVQVPSAQDRLAHGVAVVHEAGPVELPAACARIGGCAQLGQRALGGAHAGATGQGVEEPLAGAAPGLCARSRACRSVLDRPGWAIRLCGAVRRRRRTAAGGPARSGSSRAWTARRHATRRTCPPGAGCPGRAGSPMWCAVLVTVTTRAASRTQEARQQVRGQHPVAEVVDAELHLEAVGGPSLGARHQPGVVHQDVDPLVALGDRRSRRACTDSSDPRSRATSSRDASGTLAVMSSTADGGLRLVAHRHDHVGTGRSEGAGALEAEPAVRAGDDRDASGQVGDVVRGPGHCFSS